MTRINLVDPSVLADQHLFAEYREIKMVPAALRRSLRTKDPRKILSEVPSSFTLNKGHVKFFFGLFVKACGIDDCMVACEFVISCGKDVIHGRLH